MFAKNNKDFEDYCWNRYKRIETACDLLGIINDETYEDFVERNLDLLYEDYINSIDKTIH